MIKAFLLAVLVINFGSYFWSVFGVFRKHDQRKTLSYRILQLASMLTWAVCVYDVYKAELSSELVWAGLIGEIFFGTLYWFAAKQAKRGQLTIVFSLDAPGLILNEGPYKVIRHPCYTAYLGSYLVAALITLAPGSLIMSALMLIIYTRAAIMEEQKFADSALAAEYAAYKLRAGRFLPKLF